MGGEEKYILAVKLVIGGSKLPRRVSNPRHLFDSEIDLRMATISLTGTPDGPLKLSSISKIFGAKSWLVTFLSINMKYLDY